MRTPEDFRPPPKFGTCGECIYFDPKDRNIATAYFPNKGQRGQCLNPSSGVIWTQAGMTPYEALRANGDPERARAMEHAEKTCFEGTWRSKLEGQVDSSISIYQTGDASGVIKVNIENSAGLTPEELEGLHTELTNDTMKWLNNIGPAFKKLGEDLKRLKDNEEPPSESPDKPESP